MCAMGRFTLVKTHVFMHSLILCSYTQNEELKFTLDDKIKAKINILKLLDFTRGIAATLFHWLSSFCILMSALEFYTFSMLLCWSGY